ncbi:MAG: hypothetical protein ABI591_10575 [Kofleriaceae bacterium]
MRTVLVSLCLGTSLLGAAARRAHADGNDVEISSFEYIDVVETTDGSIWKGVVVEQQPNVRYKIATADGSLHVIAAGDVVKLSKAKNPSFHLQAGANVDTHNTTTTTTSTTSNNGVTGHFDQSSGMPAPYATAGLRLDPELDTVIPMGVLSDSMTNTSFGAGVRVGYEFMFGNFGLTAGEQTRITWWGLPGDPKNVAWTLETLAYARAALHLGRVAPYAQVAAGVDTNYQYMHAVDMSQTSLGFGLDLGAGVSIAASPNLAIDIGADYHAPTDSLNSQSPVSISSEYLAMHVGASIRL